MHAPVLDLYLGKAFQISFEFVCLAVLSSAVNCLLTQDLRPHLVQHLVACLYHIANVHAS